MATKDRMLKEPPRQISRRENRDRYEGMLAYTTAYSQEAIARTFRPTSLWYCGSDALKRKEMADGGMIREDQRAPSNLPEQAIHCEFPNRYFAKNPYIDDTALGNRGDIEL